FENILALAVSLHGNPTLMEHLRADHSNLARLAYRLLAKNGLLLEFRRGTQNEPGLSPLMERLGQAVVSSLPYHHSNFFVKPALHSLCLGGPAGSLWSIRLAWASFWNGLRSSVELRGGKESFRLLANDLRGGLSVLISQYR